jgi:N-formylglutamate deformylase
LNLPSRIEVPVLFDSPHSGRSYPADFRHAVDLATLRKCEDEYVDLLYADAPRHGALLLVPSFPRSYIDLNRLPGDIYDLKLLAQEWRDKLLELAKRWPEHLVPTIESQNGIGLIWRVVDATMDPIYDRPVSLEEMLRRLNNYYQPYHGILAEGMDVLHEQFGQAYFVDCHSMLSQGTGATLDSEPRPDFVVSDGEGATSEPGFSQLIVDCLRKKGYRVGYNDPFKGAMMVFMHGCPADGRHAVQIEARKGLYIDEETLELKDEFSKVRADLSELSHEVTEYARRGRAVLV